LKHAYDNREKIVKKAGKSAGDQMDKLRPTYEEALKFKNKVAYISLNIHNKYLQLSSATADQYDKLSEEWKKTVGKLDKHGFSDFIGLTNTKEHGFPILAFLGVAICIVSIGVYFKPWAHIGGTHQQREMKQD
jgi:hypothetical protein